MCIRDSFQGGLARRLALLDQVVDQLLELGARKRLDQVLGYPVHRHDVGEVDLGGGRAGELDFGRCV